ncbi:hypothetical protein J2X36_003087 [Methylobacterium sp. BE186]|uniref:hypothetical protein n=1 Tax=Methylobacterium sp. BE186 TaxID=2817715 RepID=UPI0028598891|nr:hypothetical protein [Methylobacterium sp. BE186]MDR7038328.1 hypothetical protein [Methylobacterium sp. BE186]
MARHEMRVQSSLLLDATDGSAILHSGPAKVGAIVSPAGLPVKWVELDRPGGKMEISDPKDGGLLPARKPRGSAGDGYIPLVYHTCSQAAA